MDPGSELTLKAAALARAAGPTWDEFLKAFEAYAEMRGRECVQAPHDKIFVAQGRAQQCSVLHELFASAKTKAAQLRPTR